MQANATYPPPTIIGVPSKVGLVRGARIALRWGDEGTSVTLLIGDHRVSRTRAELDGYSLRPTPTFVCRGRDWFFVLWTYSGTSVGQNYLLLSGNTLTLRGGFENGWAPDFPRTGIVYEYPRHLSVDESRRIGREAWIQRTWRWSSRQRRFALVRTDDLRKMPPVPYRRFRGDE